MCVNISIRLFCSVMFCSVMFGCYLELSGVKNRAVWVLVIGILMFLYHVSSRNVKVFLHLSLFARSP